MLDANGEPQPFFRRSAPPRRRASSASCSRRRRCTPARATAGSSVGVDDERERHVGDRHAGRAAPPTRHGLRARCARRRRARRSRSSSTGARCRSRFCSRSASSRARISRTGAASGAASVAALAIGGAEVRHARVPVRAGAGGYFRVTPSGAVADWHLLRATLVSSDGRAADAGERSRAAARRRARRPKAPARDALYFEPAARCPSRPWRSRSPRATAGRAPTSRRAARSTGRGRPVAYGELFYALSFEGREFASTPRRRRPAGGALLARRAGRRRCAVKRVELELDFPQEHLRVAVGGGAPYLLAAGTLAEEAGPDATLASVWSALEPPAEVVPLATLGARRELGGAAALVAARRFPWRTAALWSRADRGRACRRGNGG